MANKSEVMAALHDVVSDLREMVVFAVVQGSQNYNLDVDLDEYKSDIDIKAFIMPSFTDLFYNRKVSYVKATPYGQVEVKDIRLLSDLLSKMNSSYLELLYSEYQYINPSYRSYIESILKVRDQLVVERFPLLVKSMYGMLLEKCSALTHPYAGIKDKLEKFGGYDPKQLHHAFRLYYMMYGMLQENLLYSQVLVFEDEVADHLKKIKVFGVKSLDDALAKAEGLQKIAGELKDTIYDGRYLRTPYSIESEALGCIETEIFDMVQWYFIGE